jgi:hypothetical protein
MTRLKAIMVVAVLIIGTTMLTLAQSGPVDANSNVNLPSRTPVQLIKNGHACGSDLVSCCCHTQHGAACLRKSSCKSRGGTCAATGC